MKRSGEILQGKRQTKKISLEKASKYLRIKKEHLRAIEESDWGNLPEPTFVKGFIKSYANYLGLDEDHLLALYRREYNETKYPQKTNIFDKKKTYQLTPNKLINFTFILGVLLFIGYLALQYFSILSAPKLEVTSPSNDLSTNVSYIIVSGKVEKDSTISIDGEFVPVDTDGNFSKQIELASGQNIIEVIAAKRLSPKAKVTRVVRLTSR